ncbi:MAG: hypothetical protein HY521_12825 [Proteobacteria bacterium]|nr:hypothetical protein [Pseudomonadota bacterium]
MRNLRGRRLARAVAVVLFAAALTALAACGKKGPPEPPPGEPITYPRTYPAR